MKLEKKIKSFFSTVHYSDLEPIILWIMIFLYLFKEYVGDKIVWLSNVNLIPIFVVACFKILLLKLDKISDRTDCDVGYLTDIIDVCMKKKIKCEKIRIFSYDSKGFYHAILGKDFYAEEICVLMHKNVYNKEVLERWKELKKKKKTNKVTVKLHSYDRMGYGMTFDTKIGIFGSFKPDRIADQSGIASTKNTYCYTAKVDEASRQAIIDFNQIFDEIYGTK
jgi:hypothetical protein